MTSFSDIFYEVDYDIVTKGYTSADFDTKKELLESGLKRYLSGKISEIDSSKSLSPLAQKEVTSQDLANCLATMIPEQNHKDTLKFLTHYVLGISSFLQGETIRWVESDDVEYLDTPSIEVREDGTWESIKTNPHTSYATTYGCVSDMLNNVLFQKCKNQQYVLSCITGKMAK